MLVKQHTDIIEIKGWYTSILDNDGLFLLTLRRN